MRRARSLAAGCWSAGARARSGGAIWRALMRWVPMAVADLTGEWFENDLLQAAIAAHAIFGNPAGPRSAGTGGMLLQRLGGGSDAGRQRRHRHGRPGRAGGRAREDRRPKRGATIRTDARVARILTQRRPRHRRGARQRRRDPRARRRLRPSIRGRRSLNLVDPVDLPPTFVERMRALSARAASRPRSTSRSIGPPVFTALGGDAVPLARPAAHRARPRLPRARVRRDEIRRRLARAVARDRDSERARPVAARRGHTSCRSTRTSRRATCAGTWADKQEDALHRAVMRVLERRTCRARALDRRTRGLTPEDLEARGASAAATSFTARRARPVVDRAAAPRLGAVPTPIEGCIWQAPAAHPGGGLTGLPACSRPEDPGS